MNKLLVSLAFIVVIACVVYYYFITDSPSDIFSRIKPHQSQLDKTLEYIENNYQDAEAKRLLKAYAIEFEEILKNPKLSSEQLTQSLKMKDKKSTLVFCLGRHFEYGEEREQIQNMLIGTKDNLLRYHAYESQFFGKSIEYNMSFNYEKSCKNL